MFELDLPTLFFHLSLFEGLDALNISKTAHAVVSFPSLVILGAVISGCAGGAALQNQIPEQPHLLAAQAAPTPYARIASVGSVSGSSVASATDERSRVLADYQVSTPLREVSDVVGVVRGIAVSVFTPLVVSRSSTMVVAPNLVPSSAAAAFASSSLGSVP